MALELGWHPDWVLEEFSEEDIKEYLAIKTIESEDLKNATQREATEHTE